MVSEPISTVWEFYNPERHGGQGGNYMFLLKAFGNAPYYSGETKKFGDRFANHATSHGKGFADGMRTFMRRPFIDECNDRSHAGFAARWWHYKQQSEDKQERLVWVPTGTFNEAMGREGATFWANEVALLVSTRGAERLAVEKRVQLDIMDYYDGLLGRAIDWRVGKDPSVRARLVGHGPSVLAEPTLLYRLDAGQAEGARAFFATLGT